jgi:hypothetical protein
MRMFLNEEIAREDYVFFVDTHKGFQLARWRRYGSKMITTACDFGTHLPIAAGLLTEGAPSREDALRWNLCYVQAVDEKAFVGFSHLEYRNSQSPMSTCSWIGCGCRLVPGFAAGITEAVRSITGEIARGCAPNDVVAADAILEQK